MTRELQALPRGVPGLLGRGEPSEAGLSRAGDGGGEPGWQGPRAGASAGLRVPVERTRGLGRRVRAWRSWPPWSPLGSLEGGAAAKGTWRWGQ